SSEHAKDMDSNQNPFEHITLIDTFTNKLSPSSLETSYETLIIPPFYIGEDTSELFLAYNAPDEVNPFEMLMGDIFSSHPSILTGNFIDNINLTIYVDSSQYIGNRTIINQSPPWEDRAAWRTWQPVYGRGNVLSYPVFIKNHRSQAVLLGIENTFFLLLQAQDTKGEWRTVSRLAKYCMDDDGFNYFYLRSQQIALASCPVFTGNYKTKLRLAFAYHHSEIEKNRLYSNEFTGYVDYDLIH
ncbi:MAG: hypothetical protein MK212_21350, partial [Saprospiraceae bacterium]|nr:hypothetical protein [Saprospiraceae bacterium]